MNQTQLFYFSALRQMQWQDPEHFSYPSALARTWLLETGSLSALLAQQCHTFSVELIAHHSLSETQLSPNERGLLPQEPCLWRQVALLGDQVPWVLGSTLIPESSLAIEQHNFAEQGNTPLGSTVFGRESSYRDALSVAELMTPQGRLLARRSRLWCEGKPLLIAELFLFQSPIYRS